MFSMYIKCDDMLEFLKHNNERTRKSLNVTGFADGFRMCTFAAENRVPLASTTIVQNYGVGQTS